MTILLFAPRTSSLQNVAEQTALDRPCHANTLARIAMYATGDVVDRFAWWSHPNRAAMRNDPPWALIFSHLSLAACVSE